MPKITHIVDQGECISSIAKENGFFWKTIWDYGENSKLKQDRGDPNVLLPGDQVIIPEKTRGEESRGADSQYKFLVKGEPAKLRLRLTKPKKKDPKPPKQAAAGDQSAAEDPPYEPYKPEFEPRANVPYVLIIDGDETKGSTDGDGRIEVKLPPDAQAAKLILNQGEQDEEIIPLGLGHMDPISSTTGVRKRLKNLGFYCAESGEEITPDLDSALRKFQEAKSLKVTGEINQETKDKLKEAHGN